MPATNLDAKAVLFGISNARSRVAEAGLFPIERSRCNCPPNAQTAIIVAGKNAPTVFGKGANNTCAVKTLGTLVDWRVVLRQPRPSIDWGLTGSSPHRSLIAMLKAETQ
jgi:hypothetical protein